MMNSGRYRKNLVCTVRRLVKLSATPHCGRPEHICGPPGCPLHTFRVESAIDVRERDFLVKEMIDDLFG